MPPKLKIFLMRWVINTLAVYFAAHIVHGITWRGSLDLLMASLLLGILNAFVRPILMFFSLPLLIFTLGLFTLFINGLLLYFVGWLMKPDFTVESFHAAFWGALIVTIISMILNVLSGAGGSRIQVQRRPPPPGPPEPPGGDGPVIDV